MAVRVPSLPTFLLPRRTGSEKSHTSTVLPGRKPDDLMRTVLPGLRRTFPDSSSEVGAPFASSPPITAFRLPAVTTN